MTHRLTKAEVTARRRTMAELELDITEAQLDRRAEITHYFVFAGDPERAYTLAVATVRAAREMVAAQAAVAIERFEKTRSGLSASR
jgi:hypothetical protein